MRRFSNLAILITIALSITAGCSPYDPPAAAETVTTTTAPNRPAQSSTDPCAPGDKPCWKEHIELRRIWIAEVRAQRERARIARIYAFAYAVEQARLQRLASTGRYVQGIEVCNGRTLPTCGIVQRESRFNPNARNPRSTAWGLYQFLRSTWRGVCPEFPHGSASVAQQVECARRLWDGGRGSYHWRLTR